MRKGEIKSKLERIGDKLIMYIGQQYRWEHSCNPEISDKKCFFKKDEAIDYVEKLKLDIGFYGEVGKLVFDYDAFNEAFEFGSDLQLEEICKNGLILDFEQVHRTKTNEGQDIEGSILVCWSWEKYVGYCRNLHSIRIANHNETENSIYTGNEESTFKQNESILLTKEEIENLDTDEIKELIYETLNKDSWKWNYFTTNISETIETFYN